MEETIIEFDGEHYHLDEMTTEKIAELIERYKDIEEFEWEIVQVRRYLVGRVLRERKEGEG